jgi:hypothetical protein
VESWAAAGAVRGSGRSDLETKELVGGGACRGEDAVRERGKERRENIV